MLFTEKKKKAKHQSSRTPRHTYPSSRRHRSQILEEFESIQSQVNHMAAAVAAANSALLSQWSEDDPSPEMTHSSNQEASPSPSSHTVSRNLGKTVIICFICVCKLLAINSQEKIICFYLDVACRNKMKCL